jgi:phosphoglycolate phosphatase
VAVIDHHQVTGKLPKENEVRSNLGSCCSVIWNLLKIEDEEYFIDSNVGTALYYGLYSDSNAFSEISHPLDRDMIDTLPYNKSLILKLKNMNLTLKEARIAGVAMLGVEYHKEQRYAILRSEPCDPNILGLIGDFIVAVDSIDVCLVYSVLSFGVKFSIRSCSKETRADELASFIANNIGSGGGHMEKSGGLLKNELIIKQYPDYTEIDDDAARHSISNIIRERMSDYFENSDIIYAIDTTLDTSKMNQYVTPPFIVGYVRPKEFIKSGSMAIVRTIGGDINIEVKDNTVLIINMYGFVSAISEEKFNSSYSKTRKKFTLQIDDYQPTIKNADNGKTFALMDMAKACLTSGENDIYARKLKKTTKLFPYWDTEKYMVGQKGDYICVNKNDPHDMFIIDKTMFKQIYESANK